MPPAGAEIVNTLKITISPIASVTYRLTADQRWDRPEGRYIMDIDAARAGYATRRLLEAAQTTTARQ